MSDHSPASTADQDDRLIRMICYAGLAVLPLLMLFVHLLVIYRS